MDTINYTTIQKLTDAARAAGGSINWEASPRPLPETPAWVMESGEIYIADRPHADGSHDLVLVGVCCA